MSVDSKPRSDRTGLSATKTKVRTIDKAVDPLERGLPANVDAERFVLGAVLLDGSRFSEVAVLGAHDFSLEDHRRIFQRMQDLEARRRD